MLFRKNAMKNYLINWFLLKSSRKNSPLRPSTLKNYFPLASLVPIIGAWSQFAFCPIFVFLL